ncbi:MAG: hypothetical protein ABI572_09500 [Actinomycetota bacterium]
MSVSSRCGRIAPLARSRLPRASKLPQQVAELPAHPGKGMGESGHPRGT